jgi:broad specificity phosphatase PhoE
MPRCRDAAVRARDVVAVLDERDAWLPRHELDLERKRERTVGWESARLERVDVRRHRTESDLEATRTRHEPRELTRRPSAIGRRGGHGSDDGCWDRGEPHRTHEACDDAGTGPADVLAHVTPARGPNRDGARLDEHVARLPDQQSEVECLVHAARVPGPIFGAASIEQRAQPREPRTPDARIRTQSTPHDSALRARRARLVRRGTALRAVHALYLLPSGLPARVVHRTQRDTYARGATIASMARTARVVLVRHGQASAISGDYDQLSDLGREQSRLLAGHFERFAFVPDRVWVGPRKRHAQTHAEAKLHGWPEHELVSELDEHHAVQLLVALGPSLGQRDDELGNLAREAFTQDHGNMRKALTRVFTAIIPAWARGEVVHPDVEPFDAFRARIRRFVDRVRESEGTSVAFTSGGAISAIIAEAHGLDTEQLLDVMWHVKNASITEVVSRDGRLSIASMNGTPHLGEARLLTGV